MFPGAAQPRVAVVREEGSNGDREMSASLHMAGFEVTAQRSSDDACHLKWVLTVLHHRFPHVCMQVWDVTMQDLTSGSLTLDSFKAVVFVGGFSYADVLGSAKGKKISNPQSDTCWVQSLCFVTPLPPSVSPPLSQVGLLLLHLTPRPKLSLSVSGGGATHWVWGCVTAASCWRCWAGWERQRRTDQVRRPEQTRHLSA